MYGRSYGGNSYRGSYGYSRDDKESMIEQLKQMATETRDGKVKEAIHEVLREME